MPKDVYLIFFKKSFVFFYLFIIIRNILAKSNFGSNHLFFIFVFMQGTIKVLKEGFGFIKSEETPDDVFFHANNLEWVAFDDLNEGDTLSFEIGEGKNGKQQAIEVTLAS